MRSFPTFPCARRGHVGADRSGRGAATHSTFRVPRGETAPMSTDGTPPRSIGAVLAEFATLMVEDSSTQAVLDRLGAYCTELLPVHGVGVLLRAPKGGMEVATANTEAGL